MTKVLVACVDYPNANKRPLNFVHERNRYYINAGIHVEVLNFAADREYEFEGVRVLPLSKVTEMMHKYEDYILICHAPNIRNHYIFLKKYKDRFRHTMFFFHGHEIVDITEAYPEPYEYVKPEKVRETIQRIYDRFKLSIWKKYFNEKDLESDLIFVSESLKSDFYKYVKAERRSIEGRSHVIFNSAGEIFCRQSYDAESEKKYDFITIRSNLDSSVYCADLIVKSALLNSDKKYLIIGKGKFFDHNQMPDNVVFVNKNMNHKEMIMYINMARCALMPTRRDSQGVMACELATFGIPLLTSSLNVCHEMFEGFINVRMSTEDKFVAAVCEYEKINPSTEKSEKFMPENTIQREVELIEKRYKI